jgi:CPA1 family monovalent cation:H+ antiporter
MRRLQTAIPSDGAPGDDQEDAKEMERYKELRLQLLNVERSTLLGLRREGHLDPTLFRSIEQNLDHDEARIRGS